MEICNSKTAKNGLTDKTAINIVFLRLLSFRTAWNPIRHHLYNLLPTIDKLATQLLDFQEVNVRSVCLT